MNKIDLTKGYCHVPLTDHAKEVCVIVMPEGQFWFLYLPFGFVGVPGKFTLLMRKLFGAELHVVSFNEDILVHTEKWSEYVKTLRRVLSMLHEANFAIHPTKCYFGFSTIEFLGHIVDRGLLSMNPDILRVDSGLRNSNNQEANQILSKVGYYRDHVPDYATIALPLTEATKNRRPDKLVWREAEEKSYIKVAWSRKRTDVFCVREYLT